MAQLFEPDVDASCRFIGNEWEKVDREQDGKRRYQHGISGERICKEELEF